MSIRLPRYLVVIAGAVVIALPAAIAFATNYDYRYDEQGRGVKHRHTDSYGVYSLFSLSGLSTNAGLAISDWQDQLAERDTVEMKSIASTSNPDYAVRLHDYDFGDNELSIMWTAPFHPPDVTVVKYDTSRAQTWSAAVKQGKTCNVLGQILGLQGGASMATDRNDCMKDGSQYSYVGATSANLVDAFYGPNPSLAGALKDQAGNLHGTQTYGLDATASGHDVASIEVKIDDVRVPGGYQTRAPCDAKCTVTKHLEIDANDYPDGVHTLTAIATNEFGQSDTTSLQLKIDYPFFGYSDRWSTPDFDPQPGTSNDPIEFAQAEGTNVVRYAVNWNEVGAGAGDDSDPDCDIQTMPGAWQDLDDTYESLTGELPCNGGPATATADPPIRPILFIRGAPLAYRRTCTSDYENALVANNEAANDAWRGFAHNVARRYPDVKGIEVWNEPNLADHWGGCDVSSQDAAERYAQLLQLAYEGIQAGHPDTPVIFGALFPWENSTTDIRAKWTEYRADVFGTPTSSLDGHHVYGLFDKFGLHPYRSLHDRDQNGRDFGPAATEDVEDARDFLGNHNASDKQVWVTEVGATTGDDGAKEVEPDPPLTLNEVQARKLRQIYDALRVENVPVAVFYRLSDVDTASEPPGFGVLRLPSLNFAKKPAYDCLAQARGEGGSCP